MVDKKFFTAIFAGFLAMFLLAGVWNWFIVREYVVQDVPILLETPNMVFLVAGYLVLSFLMVSLYPRFSKGGNFLIEGLKFGVIISLLWMLPFNLVLHGVYEFPKIVLVVDALWALVEQGAGGIAIAFIYSRKK